MTNPPQLQNGSVESAITKIAESNNLDNICWSELRQILLLALDKAIETFPTIPQPSQESDASVATNVTNIQNVHAEYAIPAEEPIDAYRTRIRQSLEAFGEPPFTIQRLCELLSSAKSQHKTIYKYLRAVEKVVGVTSHWSETLAPPEEAQQESWFARTSPEDPFVAGTWAVPEQVITVEMPNYTPEDDLAVAMIADDDQMDMFAPPDGDVDHIVLEEPKMDWIS